MAAPQDQALFLVACSHRGFPRGGAGRAAPWTPANPCWRVRNQGHEPRGIRRLVAGSETRFVALARWHLMQPSPQLADDDGDAHWIARDTEDPAALHAVALRYGVIGHPIVRALETSLHAF